jgi:hypothetical protein
MLSWLFNSSSFLCPLFISQRHNLPLQECLSTVRFCATPPFPIQLYTMAAEQGDVHAMFNLGLLCTSKVKVLTNQMKWHGNGGPKHTRKIHFHYHRYIALQVHPIPPPTTQAPPPPRSNAGQKNPTPTLKHPSRLWPRSPATRHPVSPTHESSLEIPPTCIRTPHH